jgi:CBS domain-containing protein
MKVAEVMVRDAKFCYPYQDLGMVTEIMWKAGCGALPVVDESGSVWSMITDRDVAIALGTRNVRASDILVSEVAIPRYFACEPDDDIHSALKTMAAQEVRRLPVVDELGRLAGILSIDDIILHAKASSSINFTDIVKTLQAIYRQPAHGEVALADTVR